MNAISPFLKIPIVLKQRIFLCLSPIGCALTVFRCCKTFWSQESFWSKFTVVVHNPLSRKQPFGNMLTWKNQDLAIQISTKCFFEFCIDDNLFQIQTPPGYSLAGVHQQEILCYCQESADLKLKAYCSKDGGFKEYSNPVATLFTQTPISDVECFEYEVEGKEKSEKSLGLHVVRKDQDDLQCVLYNESDWKESDSQQISQPGFKQRIGSILSYSMFGGIWFYDLNNHFEVLQLSPELEKIYVLQYGMTGRKTCFIWSQTHLIALKRFKQNDKQTLVKKWDFPYVHGKMLSVDDNLCFVLVRGKDGITHVLETETGKPICKLPVYSRHWLKNSAVIYQTEEGSHLCIIEPYTKRMSFAKLPSNLPVTQLALRSFWAPSQFNLMQHKLFVFQQKTSPDKERALIFSALSVFQSAVVEYLSS